MFKNSLIDMKKFRNWLRIVFPEKSKQDSKIKD